MKKNVIHLCLVLLFMSVLPAYQEEEDYPFSPVVVLSINGMDSIAIRDTLIFVSNNRAAVNEIRIFSEPANIQLFVSTDGRKFDATDKNTFSVQKEDLVFQFYLKKKGFERSGLYTLIFSRKPAEFKTTVQLYPNPADSIVNIVVSGKIRGIVETTLFDLSGKFIFQPEEFLKVTDSLKVDYEIHNLQDGLYFIRVRYGDNVQQLKLLKR